MQSKLSRNSRRRLSGRIMEKENLTHIMKDREREANLKRVSTKCRKIRLTRSLKKTP
jgi:hypothetical protein